MFSGVWETHVRFGIFIRQRFYGNIFKSVAHTVAKPNLSIASYFAVSLLLIRSTRESITSRNLNLLALSNHFSLLTYSVCTCIVYSLRNFNDTTLIFLDFSGSDCSWSSENPPKISKLVHDTSRLTNKNVKTVNTMV